MATLHIVLGGIKNGDMDWLERAAGTTKKSGQWVMPKSAHVGDDVVVFIGGIGFFATAKVYTAPKPRLDWPGRRFGARLHGVKLIDPPITLDAIRSHLPRLKWANFPRSIHTPSPDIASLIVKFIKRRRAIKMSPLRAAGDHAEFEGPTRGLPPSSSISYKVLRTTKGPAWTYAMRFGTRNVWKIGFTQNLKARLIELNKHVPDEVLREKWSVAMSREWPTALRAYECEKLVLSLTAGRRTKGERIQCRPQTIRSAWRTAIKS